MLYSVRSGPYLAPFLVDGGLPMKGCVTNNGWRRWGVFIGAVVCIIFLQVETGRAQTWGSITTIDYDVDDHSYSNTLIGMDFDSNNRPIAVYCDDPTDTLIYLYFSDPSIPTYGAVSIGSCTGGYNSNADIKLNPDTGVILVIYNSGSSSALYAARCSGANGYGSNCINPGNWSSGTAVISGGTAMQVYDLDYDAYNDRWGLLYASGTSMIYSTSTTGTSWTPQTTISCGSANCETDGVNMRNIAHSGNGKIAIAYPGRNVTYGYVYPCIKWYDGSSWSASKCDFESQSYQYAVAPDVAFDSSNNLAMVYALKLSSNYTLKESLYNWSTWTSTTIQSSSLSWGNYVYPGISLRRSDGGELSLIYNDPNLRYRKKTGSSWGNYTTIASGSFNCGEEHAISSNGAVAVLYIYGSGYGHYDYIRYAYAPPTNSPPAADAGPDQTGIAEEATISLSGTCTDSNPTDTLTEGWSQTGGTSCGAIGGASDQSGTSPLAVSASCIAPDVSANETLVFQLTCGDGQANATDTVDITVNAAPTAMPQSVSTAEDTAKFITLSGSDPNGEPLSYSIVTGPSHGALNGIPPNVIYIPEYNYHDSDSFTFTVTDGIQDSGAATISISVGGVNDIPVADAGPDQNNVTPPTVVFLDGTGSFDVDGDGLTYSWTQVSGPSAALSDSSTAQPTFSPTASGIYTFRLIVNDGTIDSNPDDVDIPVMNVAPVVEACPNRAVDPYGNVTLTCNATDANGDALMYSWTKISGPSLPVDFPTADPELSFTVPRAPPGTTIVLRCGASDGAGGNGDDEVVLTVNAKPPFGDLNFGRIDERRYAFDAGGFEFYNSDEATYQWTVIDAPTGATAILTGDASAGASFAGDRVGDYTVRVCVSDGYNQTCREGTVSVENVLPVVTVEDQYREVEYVLGSGNIEIPVTISDDNNDSIATGRWEIVSGPDTLRFVGNAIDTMRYQYKRGTYQIRKYVCDENGGCRYSSPIMIHWPNNPPEIEDEEIVFQGATLQAGRHTFSHFTGSVTVEALFSDYDGDNLAYTWDVEAANQDVVGFTYAGSGRAVFRIRKAGTTSIVIAVNDGYGGTTSQRLAIYQPVPDVDEDDLSIVISQWEASGTVPSQIRGQLSSPVWPVVTVNGVVSDVALSESPGTINSLKANAYTGPYDTYLFSTANIPNDDAAALSIQILTELDGEQVLLASKSISRGEIGGDEQPLDWWGRGERPIAGGGGCSLIPAR